jgi:hypothetical protein
MTNGREETLCDVCLYAWDRRFCVKCLEKIPRILMQREIASLKAENEEQARLLGAGGSREARLMAQVEELKRENERMRKALEHVASGDEPGLEAAYDEYCLREKMEYARKALSAGEEKKS